MNEDRLLNDVLVQVRAIRKELLDLRTALQVVSAALAQADKSWRPFGADGVSVADENGYITRLSPEEYKEKYGMDKPKPLDIK